MTSLKRKIKKKIVQMVFIFLIFFYSFLQCTLEQESILEDSNIMILKDIIKLSIQLNNNFIFCKIPTNYNLIK